MLDIEGGLQTELQEDVFLRRPLPGGYAVVMDGTPPVPRVFQAVVVRSVSGYGNFNAAGFDVLDARFAVFCLPPLPTLLEFRFGSVTETRALQLQDQVVRRNVANLDDDATPTAIQAARNGVLTIVQVDTILEYQRLLCEDTQRRIA